MEVYNDEHWAMGLALWDSVKKGITLQTHGVTEVAGFTDSQEAVQRMENLEPRPV